MTSQFVSVSLQSQSIWDCLLHLAGVCDGANTQDAVGFNGADSDFGKQLADSLRQYGRLSEKQTFAAWKMMKKYRRQLKKAGLELPKEYDEVLQGDRLSGDTWRVRNLSKGSQYTVTASDFETRCECIAGQNGATCDHVKWVWAQLPDPNYTQIDTLHEEPNEAEAILTAQIIELRSPYAPFREGLGNQQQAAFDLAIDWFKAQTSTPFVLKGYAGVGKSFTIQRIMKAIQSDRPNLRIALVAPTHKAKKVLLKFAAQAGLENVTVETIHSLLHVRPGKPDSNGKRQLISQFKQGKHYREFDLVAVDEASMIGSELIRWQVVTPNKARHLDDWFDQLESAESAQNWGRCRDIRREIDTILRTGWRPDQSIAQILEQGQFHAPTIFMGDPAQLPPIEDESDQSPVFEIPNGYELTEVQRYDGAIAQYVTRLRSNLSAQFPGRFVSGGNITRHVSTDWLSNLIEACEANREKDSDNVRALAWTNKRVHEINTAVRGVLYEGLCDQPYLEGERVFAKEAVMVPNTDRGYLDYEIFLHSCAEAQIREVQEDLVPILDADGRPTDLKVPCYKLSLVSELGEMATVTTAIDPEAIEILTYYLRQQKSAIAGIDNPAERAKAWAYFYQVLDQFNVFQAGKAIAPRLQYAYALTVHQSQGSTFAHTFVDVANILTASYRGVEYRNRLLYVACTRPSQHLSVLSNF